MTTKEQERKALEQIRKILATLDADGWVATAMDGMIEDAEENIENDFALSWKDRAVAAEDQNTELLKKVKEQETILSLREMNLQSVQHDLEVVCGHKREYHDAMISESNRRAAAEQKVEELEGEIIKLKAKLYDMMTK